MKYTLSMIGFFSTFLVLGVLHYGVSYAYNEWSYVDAPGYDIAVEFARGYELTETGRLHPTVSRNPVYYYGGDDITPVAAEYAITCSFTDGEKQANRDMMEAAKKQQRLDNLLGTSREGGYPPVLHSTECGYVMIDLDTTLDFVIAEASPYGQAPSISLQSALHKEERKFYRFHLFEMYGKGENTITSRDGDVPVYYDQVPFQKKQAQYIKTKNARNLKTPKAKKDAKKALLKNKEKSITSLTESYMQIAGMTKNQSSGNSTRTNNGLHLGQNKGDGGLAIGKNKTGTGLKLGTKGERVKNDEILIPTGYTGSYTVSMPTDTYVTGAVMPAPDIGGVIECKSRIPCLDQGMLRVAPEGTRSCSFGCTPLAMLMIMGYYDYTKQLNGQYDDLIEGDESYTISPGMQSAGTQIREYMGTNCSGGTSSDVTITDRFLGKDIEDGIRYAREKGFTNSVAKYQNGTPFEFFPVIKREIDANRPLIIRAGSYDVYGNRAGHSLVAYGYASKSTAPIVRVNYGWASSTWHDPTKPDQTYQNLDIDMRAFRFSDNPAFASEGITMVKIEK